MTLRLSRLDGAVYDDGILNRFLSAGPTLCHDRLNSEPASTLALLQQALDAEIGYHTDATLMLCRFDGDFTRAPSLTAAVTVLNAMSVTLTISGTPLVRPAVIFTDLRVTGEILVRSVPPFAADAGLTAAALAAQLGIDIHATSPDVTTVVAGSVVTVNARAPITSIDRLACFIASA